MRKDIIFIFVIIYSIFFSGTGYSREDETIGNPEEAFYKANLYYTLGDYNRAISENEAILKLGLKSGNLYYNIGNCYVKKGEIGKAILNYERAKRFMPRDSALLSNLRYAKSRMKQRDINVKEPFLIKELNKTFGRLTLWESIVIFNIVYYAFLFFFVLSLFLKKFKFLPKTIAFLLLCVILSTILPLGGKISDTKRGAIVITTIADAKFEPLEESMSNFPLYEGMKAYILKTKKGWNKIKRLDGKIGWVKEGNLELID